MQYFIKCFKPARSELKMWFNKGVQKKYDFYKENYIMFFAEIDIPKQHFYKFLQFMSYVSSHQGAKPNKTPVIKTCLI